MDAPPSPASRLIVEDPEGLANAIDGANLRPTRLDRRPAPSELARLRMPSSCFDFARIGPAMLFSGATTDQGYTLVFVLECPETGRSFNFSAEHRDGYIGFFAPGGQIDAITPAGYANATLTVPTPVFVGAVEAAYPEMPASLLARGCAMRIPESHQAPIRSLVAAFRGAVAADPATFADARVLRLIERDLFDAFLRALRAGGEYLCPPAPLRISRRERRLREARERIEAQLGSPICASDIATAVGLSERGLENLFSDFLGLSPAVYLRHRRLHAARRALLEGTPRPGFVKEVALTHGFWHQGRFAEYYRLFFGENPSATGSR